MLGAENNISYQLFDKTHGYWPEDREAMLGWFNLHLKGIGNGMPVKEIPFKTLPDQQLMVYAKGQRDPKVETIAEYCKRKVRNYEITYYLQRLLIQNSEKRNYEIF